MDISILMSISSSLTHGTGSIFSNRKRNVVLEEETLSTLGVFGSVGLASGLGPVLLHPVSTLSDLCLVVDIQALAELILTGAGNIREAITCLRHGGVDVQTLIHYLFALSIQHFKICLSSSD